MKRRLKHQWGRVPSSTRKPIVLVVGVLLVLLAGIIGPLPGPGGTVIFLLGIAVLATEFTWAERFRDYLLELGVKLLDIIKRYPIIFGITAAILIISFWAVVYTYVYKR